MYTSLDRIDAVESDGQKPIRYLLTDHRTVEEQATALDLAVVFALSRVLLCRRTAREQELDVEVRMTFVFGVHPRLAHAVAAAGGVVEVLSGDLPPTSVDHVADPWILLDQAMAALARQVAREEGIALDADGLRTLQEEVWSLRPTRAGSELRYFTWLVKVAAVTGEILRAQVPGSWRPVSADLSSLPWSWVDDEGRITNVPGRCERLMTQGPEQGPAVLLGLVADRQAPPGPVMPSFKTRAFSQLESVVYEPLLDKVEAEDMILVVYGEDRPNTFEYMTRKHRLSGDLETLRQQASGNLASVEPQLNRIEKHDLTVIIASGHYYAAEKLLDRAFMRRMHRELGAPLLFATAPAKGVLILMAADPGHLPALTAISELQFKKGQAQGQQLSTLAFVVVDGLVSGLARVDKEPLAAPAAPPPSSGPRKNLFSWLFGAKT